MPVLAGSQPVLPGPVAGGMPAERADHGTAGAELVSRGYNGRCRSWQQPVSRLLAGRTHRAAGLTEQPDSPSSRTHRTVETAVRIARFSRGDEVAYGVVQDASPDGAGGGGPAPDGEGLLVAELHGHPFGVGTGSVRFTGASYPLPEVRLLAPVLPTKVIAIGQNYADRVIGVVL